MQSMSADICGRRRRVCSRATPHSPSIQAILALERSILAVRSPGSQVWLLANGDFDFLDYPDNGSFLFNHCQQNRMGRRQRWRGRRGQVGQSPILSPQFCHLSAVPPSLVSSFSGLTHTSDRHISASPIRIRTQRGRIASSCFSPSSCSNINNSWKKLLKKLLKHLYIGSSIAAGFDAGKGSLARENWDSWQGSW